MKVSVLMITYNHEQFITEAIESALAQRTSFDYELVIGEDCSTDNTGRIVDDYARRNPQRIRVIRSDCNIGIRRNFDRVLQACEGEYVAMLEGDDRFICRDKLQIQAEFLDAHADHSMVFHRIRTFDELDKQRGWTGDDCTSMTENWIENLILWNYISTVTVMFRRELTKGFNVDVWPEELLYTDYGLWLWLALKGRFGFVPDIMAEYRLHAGGVCSSQTREADERNWLSVYPHAEKLVGPQYRDLVRRQWYSRLYKFALDTCNQYGPEAARPYARDVLFFRPLHRHPMQRLKMMFMSYAPGLFNAIAGRVGYPRIANYPANQEKL